MLKSLQIFSVLFSPSLQHQQVPCLCDDSIITPAPKSKAPESPNNHRHAAHTSLITSFERIVKNALVTVVHEILDPSRFAYRPGRGVDDATSTVSEREKE